MQKRQLKLYGFKLKDCDIVNLFNATDLIGYEKDNKGNWFCNGGNWMINEPSYIIDCFYDFFSEWDYLTVDEFNEIVASDEDLSEFDCILIDRNFPIEKLFNKKVTYADIESVDDLDNFTYRATYTPMFEDKTKICDEPIYYTVSEMVSEIEDNNNIGKYRIIY